jgi:hypothetical protein
MRAFQIVVTAAVLAFLAWVAWDAHLAALREVAEEPWTPPAHVWSCSTLHVVAAEPGGAPLRIEILESMCGMEARFEMERLVAAPTRQADARSRLDMDAFGPEFAKYEMSDVRRTVLGVEWRRWDAVGRGR